MAVTVAAATVREAKPMNGVSRASLSTGTSVPPTVVGGLTTKLPTMLEWNVQKYVYVPERPLVLIITLVGVLGVN
jgi:hypothetical protein